MNSITIMQAITDIADLPGKNDKLALLKKHMQDPEFVEVLNLALNPFITFGQKPSRYTSFLGTSTWDGKTNLLLTSLATRRLTGDAAKNAISAEFARLDALSAELLWRVINKDLKAGFSESSVNKVVKGTIPEFPYMRCSLPKDANLEEWAWSTGIISQLKADGMFFNADIELTSINLTSRQGTPLPEDGFLQLRDQFAEAFHDLLTNSLEYKLGAQTHGELLVEDDEGKVLPREIANGMLNKVIKSGGDLPAGHKITAVLWDIIPKEKAVKKGVYAVPYLSRLRTLNSILGMLKASRNDKALISVIETRVVRTYKEAMEHYTDARRRKQEGTVAKKPTMFWKDGTSKDQVKLKQEVPVELEIEGFEEGKEGGKTANTFGSLRCKTSDGLLKVNVGTGLSDELREQINQNREDWLGGIITVKSNEIMYAARGKLTHSLFLPVYVERRLDKSVADTFEQVEEQFANAVEPE